MKKIDHDWTIGNVKIRGRVGLAPMAGVCDTAYRILAKEQGASWMVTEMVSAMGLMYGNVHSQEMLHVEPIESPISIQIFGSDANALSFAAQAAEKAGAHMVDINMGCPVKKIVSSGDGSALMKNPTLAETLVRAVVKSVSIPVTVKMRLGWDANTINAVPFALRMEAAGAAAVAVHGRTREQMYDGRADWEEIRKVKAALSIPVIGNGDVVDGMSARSLLDETGCDALMVGRGAQGNPWIFKTLRTYLEEGIDCGHPTFSERLEMLRRHFMLLCHYKSEPVAAREIRTHAGWYIRGLPSATKWRNLLNNSQTKTGFISLIDEYESYLNELKK